MGDKHWWKTMPGILSGVAAVILAITGVIKIIIHPLPPSKCKDRFFAAKDYSNARNIGVGTLGYGEVITNGGDGSKEQENMVEFSFQSDGSCNYRVDIEYAADEARSVVLSFNGVTINRNALSEKTGGWYPKDQKVLPQGTVMSVPGLNTLQLYRNKVFPHIKSVRLISTSNQEGATHVQ